MSKCFRPLSLASHGTMKFGSTAKVLAKCMLKYYRISECMVLAACVIKGPIGAALGAGCVYPCPSNFHALGPDGPCTFQQHLAQADRLQEEWSLAFTVNVSMGNLT